MSGRMRVLVLGGILGGLVAFGLYVSRDRMVGLPAQRGDTELGVDSAILPSVGAEDTPQPLAPLTNSPDPADSNKSQPQDTVDLLIDELRSICRDLSLSAWLSPTLERYDLTQIERKIEASGVSAADLVERLRLGSYDDDNSALLILALGFLLEGESSDPVAYLLAVVGSVAENPNETLMVRLAAMHALQLGSRESVLLEVFRAGSFPPEGIQVVLGGLDEPASNEDAISLIDAVDLHPAWTVPCWEAAARIGINNIEPNIVHAALSGNGAAAAALKWIREPAFAPDLLGMVTQSDKSVYQHVLARNAVTGLIACADSSALKALADARSSDASVEAAMLAGVEEVADSIQYVPGLVNIMEHVSGDGEVAKAVTRVLDRVISGNAWWYSSSAGRARALDAMRSVVQFGTPSSPAYRAAAIALAVRGEARDIEMAEAAALFGGFELQSRDRH